MRARFWIWLIAFSTVSGLVFSAPRPQEAPKKTDPRISQIDPEAMRLAIEDLAASFPGRYPKAQEYLKRLDGFAKRWADIQKGVAANDPAASRALDELFELQREALLANPLLDFDRLLLVRRGAADDLPEEPQAPKPAGKPGKDQAKVAKKTKKKSDTLKYGLPQNWQGNCSLPKNGFDNEIAVLSPIGPSGQLKTVFRPKDDVFVGDVRLHFDAEKLMFSMSRKNGTWQVYETGLDGSRPTQVTPDEPAEVDNYDACYLPDERVIFSSTANMQGVPCVGGSAHAANLALLDRTTGKARMLTFEQDHDWCPTLLADGRVLYTRWEYTDTAHYFTRILFAMNPDGTGQGEYYGSNSYWPNSLFYCRPIPNKPMQFVGIVGGHHGVPRMGELVLFDTLKGRHEASGVVQRIPGRGKTVEPVIADTLVNASWPRFLHPCPLSDKYFLVSGRLAADREWGIYLVDVFDNMVLVKELPGNSLFEPIPFKKTPRPPVIADKVDLAKTDATVYLVDVYQGPGLVGVPRGTVKQLRVFAYNYCYQGIGGHHRLGVESSWDVKRLIGTVPVEEDGSALFTVPANTPISVQPLDADGRAIQLMRSWFTAMPGETLSCVGCHESQNKSTVSKKTMAATREASLPKALYDSDRGFGFLTEVQPVLEKHCVGCHNGKPTADGKEILNFADTELRPVMSRGKSAGLAFYGSYLSLHPYTVRPGPESDYHLLTPMDFHASVSPLVQLLQKGHYDVKLERNDWDRLYTWIDLNVPCFGSWCEAYPESVESKIKQQFDARTKNLFQLASVTLDPKMEAKSGHAASTAAGAKSQIGTTKTKVPKVPGWPFDAAEAKRRQAEGVSSVRRTIDLGGGKKLELVRIPAGEYVMGDPAGLADETPSRVKIASPFWMGALEVSNEQFAAFDPKHDSRVIDQQGKDHNTPGYPANLPQQPVIRVSWQEAMAFCRWLSQGTGERFSLPTEAQWEWACRAGTNSALWFGPIDSDFTKCANLGDQMLRNLAVNGVNPKPMDEPGYLAFLPRVDTLNDGQMIAGPVGSYQPNPWGLHDMHGNVAEWTRSSYRADPYKNDGRDDPSAPGSKVVRGGSWRDRPERARSGFRLAFEPWQKVFTVGFRVVCEAEK